MWRLATISGVPYIERARFPRLSSSLHRLFVSGRTIRRHTTISGVVLEQAGQRKEAIGQYEEALSLKPDYTEAQSRLARARSSQ